MYKSLKGRWDICKVLYVNNEKRKENEQTNIDKKEKRIGTEERYKRIEKKIYTSFPFYQRSSNQFLT